MNEGQDGRGKDGKLLKDEWKRETVLVGEENMGHGIGGGTRYRVREMEQIE